ncbi:twin-arginine translocase TatA/TatE family subunit [Pseudoalteromonas gelatinilytica]
MAGISVWQLLIVLAIVLLLFGSKKLKNIGSDLGFAIKGFNKSLKDEESTAEEEKTNISVNKLSQTEDSKRKV